MEKVDPQSPFQLKEELAAKEHVWEETGEVSSALAACSRQIPLWGSSPCTSQASCSSPSAYSPWTVPSTPWRVTTSWTEYARMGHLQSQFIHLPSVY